MKNRRNYYRLLQVQPDAPFEVIRASYRALMRELGQHPDLGGSSSTAALLNEAYQVLSDPQRRASYDRELFQKYTKSTSSTGRSDKRPASSLSCPLCRQALGREPRPGERCSTCQAPLPSSEEWEAQKEDRRAIERAQLDKRILYYSKWPGKAREAQMINFSAKGMKLLCPESLPPGTVLKIENPHFTATSTVTHVCEKIVGKKRLYSIGVSFAAIRFENTKGLFLDTSA
jgi:curved DNA-binding protein CbpA